MYYFSNIHSSFLSIKNKDCIHKISREIFLGQWWLLFIYSIIWRSFWNFRYLLKPIGAGAYFSDFYRKNRQSRGSYEHVASRPTRGHGEKFLCVVAHYRIGYRPHAAISAHRVTFSREIGMRKRKYRWLSRRLPSDGPRRETKLDAGHNGADIVGPSSFLRTPCKEMTPQETRQLRRTTKSAHRTRD